jgi:ATP-dependent Zn protease
MLKKHKAKLEKVTKTLLKTETMSKDEFVEIFTGKKAKKRK